MREQSQPREEKLLKESRKKKLNNVITIVNSLLTILPEDNHLDFLSLC